jgi:hypothetical protein
MTNYKLAICERYNKSIHGDLNIHNTDYIVTYLIELGDFYNNDFKIIIGLIKEGYLNSNMKFNIKNIKFELVEPYYSDDIMLCNLKTQLIIKIQKKWRQKLKHNNRDTNK